MGKVIKGTKKGNGGITANSETIIKSCQQKTSYASTPG